MLFAIFIKNKNFFGMNWIPKHNGHCYLRLFRHWNLFSVTTDSRDGCGLKPELVGTTFSSFNAMPAKITEKIFGYCSLETFVWYLFRTLSLLSAPVALGTKKCLQHRINLQIKINPQKFHLLCRFRWSASEILFYRPWWIFY